MNFQCLAFVESESVWIRQYPCNFPTFARHIILGDNFVNNFERLFCLINLCLRFISRFGRYCEDFTLHFTLSLSLSLSSLYPFHLFLSLSLSLSISLSLFSPSLSIYLLLPFFLSLSFSLSSLHHSLWRI